MRIAYATTFDANRVENWSGTPYYMSRAMIHEGLEVNYVGSLTQKLPPFFKAKQMWKKFFLNQRVSPRFNIVAAKNYSQQLQNKLTHLNVDLVVSPLINPITYLNCKTPIILWTDALYAALLGFYPAFNQHSPDTIRQGNMITSECLSRCRLIIFSSEWGANSASQFYGVRKEKIKVIPYGANIEEHPSPDEIEGVIKKRDGTQLRLLFLAKSWERKGGEIVLKVAQTLHERGIPIELNVVGLIPKIKHLPFYIKPHAFVSKQSKEGRNKIAQLLSESHFLFLPTRADACPMVLSEANAFALPCIATNVGGICTVIRDELNGKTFAVDASISTYCDYLVELFENRARYESLARSSYNEYLTRLNWRVAITEFKRVVKEVIF